MKFIDFLKNVFGNLISMSKNDPDYEVVSSVEEHEEAMNREDESTREELNRSSRAVEKMAQAMRNNIEGNNKTLAYGNGIFNRVNSQNGGKSKNSAKVNEKKADERELEL